MALFVQFMCSGVAFNIEICPWIKVGAWTWMGMGGYSDRKLQPSSRRCVFFFRRIAGSPSFNMCSRRFGENGLLLFGELETAGFS